MTLGQKVTIFYRASESVNKFGIDLMHWYQQKSGQLPKILMYTVFSRAPGIPARFSGDETDLNFTLTINPVKADDAANYYCQQVPPTVLYV